MASFLQLSKKTFLLPFKDFKSLFFTFLFILIIEIAAWVLWLTALWGSFKLNNTLLSTFLSWFPLLLSFLTQGLIFYIASLFWKNILQKKQFSFKQYLFFLKPFLVYFLTIILVLLPYLLLVIFLTYLVSQTTYFHEIIVSDAQWALILLPVILLFLVLLGIIFLPIIFVVSAIHLFEKKKYFICVKQSIVYYRHHWFKLSLYIFPIIVISFILYRFIPLFWSFFWTVFLIWFVFTFYFENLPSKNKIK